MEIKKTIQLELSDLIKFHSIFSKKSIILQSISMFLIFYFACLANDALFVSALLISIILYCIWMVFYILSFKRKIKKLFNNSRIAQLPKEIILDDIGLHVTSEVGNSNLPWADMDKIESKHAYYFTIKGAGTTIIPKRFFSVEENSSIRFLISQKYLESESSLKDEY